LAAVGEGAKGRWALTTSPTPPPPIPYIFFNRSLHNISSWILGDKGVAEQEENPNKKGGPEAALEFSTGSI